MTNHFKIPVLFLVFNRPEKTRRVFDQIKAIKPKYLYIAADGPRKNKENELQKCSEVREIIRKIDWECVPNYLLRDENLGCSKAVINAIDWFFKNEESGIILEDDCLPDLSFFYFCDELLNKYRSNDKILMISGSNLGNSFGNESYFFSVYGQIWGWATWKRAWAKFERTINAKNPPILFLSNLEKKFWIRNFKNIVWDVQWAVYSVRKNNGLAILPNKNLVTNIGFGEDATIYIDQNNKNANLKTESIHFPLNHPHEISNNKNIDCNIFRNNYYKSIVARIILKLKFRLKLSLDN